MSVAICALMIAVAFPATGMYAEMSGVCKAISKEKIENIDDEKISGIKLQEDSSGTLKWRYLTTLNLDFHYKIFSRGSWIETRYSEPYTYDSYGFQIIRTAFKGLWSRDSKTWDWDEFMMWCPFAHPTGQCDLLVYQDPPPGPPFGDPYGAFPPDGDYYGCMPPGGMINLPSGHSYYFTTQGFSTLCPHKPLYPPELWITGGGGSENKSKEGDSSVTMSTKLIDTMDLPAGLVTYYSLTITCAAGNYFDEGYEANQVKITFMHGCYKYEFWLELASDYPKVKLYARAWRICIPIEHARLYLFGKEIPIPITDYAVVIGRLTVEVEAEDIEYGIDRVEFYIDDELKAVDKTAPYTYDLQKLFGIHTIEAIAYNNAGDNASDEVNVIVFII